MRSLERVVETRIDMLELEKADEIQEDCPFCRSLDCDIIFALLFTFVIACLLVLIMVFGYVVYCNTKKKAQKRLISTNPKLFDNIQCIYSFVAGQRQRVKLDFIDFQLAGTKDNCDQEYIDIYSELKTPSDDLLTSMTPSRYCGSVSPHVRISLHNVIVIVFHSRVGKKRSDKIKVYGKYHFISDSKFNPGRQLPGEPCSFIIDASEKRHGTIYSPTYPGTYPSNFYCSYHLHSDNPNDRIHVSFRDFDIYFGGEHCPYDMMTVYDGPSNRDFIIRKVCGLQQKLEMFSLENDLFIEFNTTNPAKNDLRGFVIEYQFSNKFVNVRKLISNQKGVTHLRGTECDVRVQSNRETVHYIQSPNHPSLYPINTICTYIIDGLKGDQNLEQVVLRFETVNMTPDKQNSSISLATTTTRAPTTISSSIQESSTTGDVCEGSFVGIAATAISMKAVASDTDESWYDVTLCDKLKPGSDKYGPYISQGPRMIVVFSSSENASKNSIEMDEPLGFKAKIEFKTGKIYKKCNDWLEIYDVFKNPDGSEKLVRQAKHCWTIFPGPTITTFGAHEMRVIFSSDSFGTDNGFKAFYEIRRAFKEDVPKHSDSRHCGHLIQASDQMPSGYFSSPGFPVKYNKDLICDWQILARPGHQILLRLTKMEVEGEMSESKINCKNAIIRIHRDYGNRITDETICGTNPDILKPIVSSNDSIRISFMTAPEKVNGLKGFNFTWTEVKQVQQDSECLGEDLYLCSYTRLCIRSKLKCDGDENCGENDDTDEAHCNIAEKEADKKTVIIAAIISFAIFMFILSVFCFLFVAKYKRRQYKKKYGNRNLSTPKSSNGYPPKSRQRQPFRSQKPMGKTYDEMSDYDGYFSLSYIPSPATSRFIHHDAVGQIPPEPRHHHRHRNHKSESSHGGPSSSSSKPHNSASENIPPPSSVGIFYG
uniref:CUB domain-containing protein n=1 Tax=Panagrolaimus superbus TaxID=310955 RepID=A0A914XX19_9BILA